MSFMNFDPDAAIGVALGFGVVGIVAGAIAIYLHARSAYRIRRAMDSAESAHGNANLAREQAKAALAKVEAAEAALQEAFDQRMTIITAALDEQLQDMRRIEREVKELRKEAPNAKYALRLDEIDAAITALKARADAIESDDPLRLRNAAIAKWHAENGESPSATAREFGVSRSTVRRALREYAPTDESGQE